ncbi:hypothetical protein Scep_028668 [Stephania cephalantha]|uniref:Terpene synthase N-terminal domain-containing protein n=1 Tax=Stephania cephalantha TaxID=152367 RepID=A0AAP0EAD7_9MAGN
MTSTKGLSSFMRFQSSSTHHTSPSIFAPLILVVPFRLISMSCGKSRSRSACRLSKTIKSTFDHDHHQKGSIDRRSANYHPNIWDFNFIQSLKSDYKGEFYEKQRNKLVESVRHILLNDQNMGSLAKFELIEALQRLGIRYFFEEEIKKVLMNGHEIITSKEGLHVVASI